MGLAYIDFGHDQVRNTYPCKGKVSIRFSIKKNSVEVEYSHHPIHRDYVKPVYTKKEK